MRGQTAYSNGRVCVQGVVQATRALTARGIKIPGTHSDDFVCLQILDHSTLLVYGWIAEYLRYHPE
jgi:hypothetical protein